MRLACGCVPVAVRYQRAMPLPRPWLFVLLLAALPLAGHGLPPGDELAAAAHAWLQSLDGPQRERAVFPADDRERENWHYVPRARQGIPLKAMTAAQRELARGLIAAGLSQRGRLQVEAIIALEGVLLEMEGTARRDGGLYYFTVFGRPAPAGTWGWRVEGHHLSVNFTLVAGGRMAVTPLFFGANPAEVRIDHAHKGRRALAAEEDLGRALMKSFSPEQRSEALIAAKAPWEIITGNDREAKPPEPAGLIHARMSPDQQARLRALVEVYAGRLRPEVADAERQKIAGRGWDQVRFAWAGGMEPGEAHYYRIQGPAFLIEYDNIQNGANHIHTTWRDFEGDFGRDLLREHYAHAHPDPR